MPRHEGHQTTHERLAAVLLRAVAVLRRADIEHALIGGLASATMGRSRHTHDIDLSVAPDDAERALDALARAGFRTERTDTTWLYKAFWDGMLVDVIFVSKGGVVFDEEMRDHRLLVDVRGRPVETLSPEDMLVIKALTNAEHVPRHWYDGLSILAAGELDWSYFARPGRPHATRVCSRLLYAVADGIPVPQEPLRELFEAAMCDVPTQPETE